MKAWRASLPCKAKQPQSCAHLSDGGDGDLFLRIRSVPDREHGRNAGGGPESHGTMEGGFRRND